MKTNLLAAGLLGIAITGGINTFSNPVHAQEEQVQFICANSFDSESGKSLPTTFAWTTRGKIAVIRWETEEFSGAGFDSQKRCDEVSPRFQEAYDNNSLNMITNGKINNQPVICTSDESGGDCNTLLMTLRPEDNSLQVLNNLKQVLNGEQVGPVKHNADIPQVYYKVDIQNFLKTAPVE